MTILIKNGRLINPSTRFDGYKDILIEGKVISKIADSIEYPADKIIDAQGKIVLPGLIDIHVHLRQPGREDLETIVRGAEIAAASGFTTICAMPNTTPPPDSPETIQFIISESKKSPIEVLPVATVTKGRKGDQLSDMETLAHAGASSFSDDGSPINNIEIMRNALILSKKLNLPILAHEEEHSLVQGGAIHEGSVSSSLGIKGIPREAEELMIARDLELSRVTGGKLHVQHLSSGGSVTLMRNAKAEGLNVTCETAPHYFTLTDEAIRVHGSNAKMNPPLCEESDRRMIIEGLRDGTIDVIATDHAPHSEKDKLAGAEKAPFGIIGLETAVPLIITKLIREENFSYVDAFSKVTCNPALIIGIDKGIIAEGKSADITMIDPEIMVAISKDTILSKCKNSPFIGMKLYGKVICTISQGNIVHIDL